MPATPTLDPRPIVRPEATATGRHRATARLKAFLGLMIAALVLASGLATADPASALAPGTPRVLGPIAANGGALVAWSVPDTGGKAPTGYTVERYVDQAPQPDAVFHLPAGQMALKQTGLTNGVIYRYRVKAHNPDGASGWSNKEAAAPQAYLHPLRPFVDPAAWITRQYQDLLGRAPSPTELAFAKIRVAQGEADELFTEVAHTPSRVGERHPVLRLYFAFFERAPEPAGATYWINKRKSGSTNLNAMASQFAASSEFKNTYGQLTNQQFVSQIYLNVFDRNADPAGLAYWTNKLNTKQVTRGQVMVGFSESNEYRGVDGFPGLSTGRVEAIDLWLAIMKKPLSDQALATYYAPHIQHGGSQGILALLLIPTNGYPK